jgi:hypothetical protein
MASTKVITLDNVCTVFDLSPVDQTPTSETSYTYKKTTTGSDVTYIKSTEDNTTTNFDFVSTSIPTGLSLNQFNIGLAYITDVPAFSTYVRGDIKLRAIYSLATQTRPTTDNSNLVIVDINLGGTGLQGFSRFKVMRSPESAMSPTVGDEYSLITIPDANKTTSFNCYLINWNPTSWVPDPTAIKNVLSSTNDSDIDLNSSDYLAQVPGGYTIRVTLANTGLGYTIFPVGSGPTGTSVGPYTYNILGSGLTFRSTTPPGPPANITYNTKNYYLVSSLPKSDPDAAMSQLPAIIFNVIPPTLAAGSANPVSEMSYPTFAVSYTASVINPIISGFFNISGGQPYFYMYDADAGSATHDVSNARFLLLTYDQNQIITIVPSTGSNGSFILEASGGSSTGFLKTGTEEKASFDLHGYWYTNAGRTSGASFNLFYVSTSGFLYTLTFDTSTYNRVQPVRVSGSTTPNIIGFTCMMCTPQSIGASCAPGSGRFMLQASSLPSTSTGLPATIQPGNYESPSGAIISVSSSYITFPGTSMTSGTQPYQYDNTTGNIATRNDPAAAVVTSATTISYIGSIYTLQVPAGTGTSGTGTTASALANNPPVGAVSL